MNNAITFVVSDITATGGIERVVTNLASNLSADGYNVRILSVHRSDIEIKYSINKDVQVDFVDSRIKNVGNPGSLLKFFNHIISALKINSYIIKNKKSAFIINTFPIAFISFISLFFVGKKYVVEHVHYYYYNKIVRGLRKRIYKMFDKIVVLTERDRVHYMNSGLDAITIPNPLSFESKRTRDVNKVYKKIIAVGRLEYQKGFDILIKSFNEIDQEIKKGWSLDIYGEGSLKKELLELIGELSLNDQVNLKGNVLNLQDVFYEYDFFVFPSRFEGFGMVLLEAMSCGLPCVSFDCPTGPQEILDNGKYGLLCENGNQEDLKQKMVTLMCDPSARAEYSIKGRHRSQDYNISNISHEWKTMLDKLNN